ncbi:MAG TPA: DUF6338 family protein [Conexibacter sp.]|nr:DUF6338 family protein [Conexibacter sp.]
MPGTLEAAIVFTLVIAPGYLFVRGFSVGRTRTPPDRDLYVLAEAVVASVVWLALVYLVEHDRLRTVGILPRSDTALEQHGIAIAWTVLAIVLAPYVLGRLGGWLQRTVADGLAAGLSWVDARRGAAPGRAARAALWGADAVGRWQMLRPPTAWDRAWSEQRARGGPVTIHLRDGLIVRGSVERVDTSPLQHQVVLSDGAGFDANGLPVELASGPGGVYIESTEIRAVFFD